MKNMALVMMIEPVYCYTCIICQISRFNREDHRETILKHHGTMKRISYKIIWTNEINPSSDIKNWSFQQYLRNKFNSGQVYLAILFIDLCNTHK